MTREKTSESGRGPAEVRELLERRATVQGWIDRLESQRGSASDHIIERVRSDYEDRLRTTLEALADHRETVEAELRRAAAATEEAQSDSAAAQDRLEEGRLRNLIGEIASDGWTAERAALEDAVREASERESAARAESARLRELLDRLDETQPTPAEDPEATVEAGPSATPHDEPASDDDPSASPAPFLADIDRAISDPAPDEDPPADLPLPEDPPFEETVPKPGLKCGECGYTNDLSAWYCGVCGADVG